MEYRSPERARICRESPLMPRSDQCSGLVCWGAFPQRTCHVASSPRRAAGGAFDFSRPTVSPGRFFALVKLWETSEARQALSTANEVCVSAPLLFASGFDLALWDRCRLGFRPSGFQRARLDVSTKRANPDHEQTAKCALTGCANPARPSGQKPQSSSSKKVMQSFIV